MTFTRVIACLITGLLILVHIYVSIGDFRVSVLGIVFSVMLAAIAGLITVIARSVRSGVRAGMVIISGGNR